MSNQNLPETSGQRSYGAISDPAVPKVGFMGNSQSELKRLNESITTHIYTINSSLKQLDEVLKSLGTKKDGQGLRDKAHVTQLSTNQIISQSTQDLHKLTALIRGKDKQSKLQVEALRSQFKEAVNTYSQKQKQVAEKMKLTMLPSAVDQLVDLEPESEDQLRQMHEQRLMQQDLEFSHGLQVERLQRVKQIEEDVLDVNEVMRELAAMVVEQEQSVNLIEDSVENVYQRVEGGRQNLEKAETYMNKRRRTTLSLCLFASGIFMVFSVLVYFSLR